MTVEKADLEAKLREIEGVVTDVEREARSNALVIGVVVVGIVVGIVAFSVWRSRRNRIRVEVFTA
jgi:heme/copper-type cytochrome/quinol oxidase subunit 2